MGKLYAPTSFFLRRMISISSNSSNERYGPIELRRLLQLMDDHDDSNRDWATFLVALSDDISAPVQAKLLQNAADCHQDVSAEATLGLARRHHPMALRLVKKSLERNSIGILDIKAAGYVANHSLVGRLNRIKKWWTGDSTYLDAAIKACRNNGRDEYDFD